MEQHVTVPDRTRLYVITFIVLGVLTFIEFSIGGIPFIPGLEAGAPDPFKVPLLAVFAASKGVLVAGIYMHLRFDSKIFRMLLLIGLVFALLLVGSFTFVMPIDWRTAFEGTMTH